MDITLLVKISAKAWCLSILAALHRGTAARQAPLLAATGAGRTAFAQSLGHLMILGLLERNPGHGHPLRPEFRLTLAGEAAASMADRVLAITPAVPLLRKSWTLPILAVSTQPRSFTGIKRDLDGVTDRALSQSLKALEAAEWMAREVDARARPIRAQYVGRDVGFQLGEAVGVGSTVRLLHQPDQSNVT